MDNATVVAIINVVNRPTVHIVFINTHIVITTVNKESDEFI